MGIIGKSFAFVMFPLSILIILEQLGLYSVTLPVDKMRLGAGLMIALQIITLIMLKVRKEELKIMDIMTAVVFIAVAIGAVASGILGIFPKEIPLILGVMMFVEGLYALH